MIRRSNIKYLVLVLLAIYILHWSFTGTNLKVSWSEQPEPLESHKNLKLDTKIEQKEVTVPDNTRQIGKANACFVVLIRNSDLHEFRNTMRQLEDRFNHKYNYPYVFLNDVPFTEEFKKLTSALTKSKTEYDMGILNEKLEEMRKNEVIYGDSPGVHFYCDIDFDPFAYVRDHDIKYAFTISMYEYQNTIPTLWDTVKEFIKQYPQYIEKDNLMDFLSDDNGETYNLCHFWSNFEIGDLNFWRSETYLKFFDFLDKKGGFFYERWGDAPVHSIAAALFLKKHQIHFFNEIGYRHDNFMHCPKDDKLQLKCHCDPNENFDFDGYSCTGR
ncbi:4854_t:CDS:2 [Dentiscutata erythropus]|uniref:4854_t:CDS:1 n=1 Tax=Dentiscutata erythropus TaxID=1348616 RepID=A0A9N8WFK4_9GLOM|nr:4854_t:CDS:2 [Dentiscutata erythropus]